MAMFLNNCHENHCEDPMARQFFLELYAMETVAIVLLAMATVAKDQCRFFE